MRHVALVAFALLLAIPTGLTATGATDDCKNAPAPGCSQVPPEGTATPTQTSTYYVYAVAANCVPANSDSCAGRPLNGAPLGIIGLVYQESNPLPGLQRHSLVLSNGQRIEPDQAILV